MGVWQSCNSTIAQRAAGQKLQIDCHKLSHKGTMQTPQSSLAPSLPNTGIASSHQPLKALFGGPLRLATGLTPLVGPDSVLLVSETLSLDLTGPLWCALVPLLDGRRTALDIVQELRSAFPPPDVLEALGVMAQENLFAAEQAPADPASRLIAFSVSGTGSSLLEQALAEQGVGVSDPAGQAALDLAVVDNYLALPEAMRAPRSRPWLPIRLAGEVGWIGPLFTNEVGACWHCLEHRLIRTREAHAVAEAQRPPLTCGPEALVMARLFAHQIARWLEGPADAEHPLRDHLVTFDAHNLKLELHPVLRRPQCVACGSGQLPIPQPIGTQDSDGGDEAEFLSEEMLLDRFSHHVDAYTGLITALEPVAGDPVHVCRSRYVRPVVATTAERAIEHFRLVAAGKGTSAVAARAGALAEALERYSSTWDGSEPLVVASAQSLGSDCILPNDSMLFSADQLTRGSEGTGIKLHVPAELDLREPIGWMQAWSLSNNTWRHVAAGWALMGYRGPGASYTVGDSNGNAAGATINDAIIRGVCELIERDGVALWWYNRARRPGVDLETLDPAYIHRLRMHYQSLDREFWVLDLTSDIGVPTFAAVSQCRPGMLAAPVIAFGSHLDPATAVLRALAEMNQMLPHARARAPREDRPPPMPWRDDSMALATLRGHDYLRPDPGQLPTRLDAFVTPAGSNLAAQVSWITAQLAKSGLELIVLDLTRPDVGLPVVRVIVPGLRHFWRRLAPGRLYDVPVELGWCAKLTSERDANPLELAI